MYKTEQEAFWAGEFGADYIERNQESTKVAANLSLFSRILRSAKGVRSTFELGANIGLNTTALGSLLPNADHSVLEINAKAVERLRTLPTVHEVFHESILEFTAPRTYDFVFTKGVLIHINPEQLQRAYNLMHALCGRYIAVIEYYNPSPTAVTYRGHENRLFKRDFAGELLDLFPDLRLSDYGSVYRRDPNFRQDDLNWFLLEKMPR